ncbi:MAG: ABC transporter permease [Candidatus Eisenbacteria bacterium]
MIAFLARRNLVRQRARTLLCVLGLAVSTALLYDMALLSSGLKASLTRVLDAIGYDLRVLPSGGLPFSSDAVLPGGHALAAELAALPGVAEAEPLWATTLYLEPRAAAAAAAPRRAVSAFALGLAPERQTMYRIERGAGIPPGATGSPAASGVTPVVLNALAAQALGAAPGDTLLVSATLDAVSGGALRPERLRVAGIGEFRFDMRTQRSLSLRPGDLARIAGRGDDPASFLLGKLAPGGSARTVAARWAALHPETEFHEVSEMLAQVRGQLSYFQQFSLILGTVSLLVTFLLVLTLQTLAVNERQGEIAILRALGLRAPRVVGLVLIEGFALAALALGPGILLGAVAARGLDAILTSSPGLPVGLSFFVFTPGALVRTVGLVLVTATLAGAYPAWLAARTNVALTLHREVT